jgi:hypothetical protein
MVVEAAIHDSPIVSICIDAPGGWNTPRKYSLPLSEIGAGPRMPVFGRQEQDRWHSMKLSCVNSYFYLENPAADAKRPPCFIQQCTFTDGSAGRRTGEYLLTLVGK